MSFRDRLFERLSPELLTGVTCTKWLRILWENRFAIDPPYWSRAAVTTLFSLRNSLFGHVEHLRFRSRIQNTTVESPIFVLGIFRSGTTYLHNLLSQDSRFAFPTRYEVSFPHTFLQLESIDKRILGVLMTSSRPQDNVSIGFDEPHEDEVALCSLVGRTFLMDLAFPRNAEFYRRYYTLSELTEKEIAQWKASLKFFLQKVTLKHNRRLILKSPGHTCRVRTLLELFPDARFIHIHRNPVDVFQSWRHMVRKIAPRWTFQRPDISTLDEDIIQRYRQVHQAWFSEKSLIPDGRLVEVSYESLKADPIGELGNLYRKLALPEFESCLPAMEKYLSGHSSYQTNKYTALDENTRRRLTDEWQRCFDEWGYQT
jgi:hypothetical protein